MASSGLPVIYGTAFFGQGTFWDTNARIRESLELCRKHNVHSLDTAQIYHGSEGALGAVGAGEHFSIDTKWPGGWDGSKKMTKDFIVESAKASVEKLKIKQVDVFYLHSPDPNTPVEETLEGVNEVYKMGLFKRFGLSNFPAEEVVRIHEMCSSKGYVLPTVYQGNYSAVARKQEKLLFPVLRELGIVFYAYSPQAGGFLSKSKQEILKGAGRFGTNSTAPTFRAMYNRPQLVDALDTWGRIADEEDVTPAELAVRWVAFNSDLRKETGDAIIIGARNLDQLDKTLAALEKGPLSEKAVREIDQMWEEIKDVAPLDNWVSGH